MINKNGGKRGKERGKEETVTEEKKENGKAKNRVDRCTGDKIVIKENK